MVKADVRAASGFVELVGASADGAPHEGYLYLVSELHRARRFLDAQLGWMQARMINKELGSIIAGRRGFANAQEGLATCACNHFKLSTSRGAQNLKL